MKRFLLLVVLGLTATSCATSPTSPSSNYTPKAVAVYVLNQGDFGQGNSTLTAYFPDSNRAENGIFRSVNGRSLGDVGNDIALNGDEAYMVVNNSNKIEVIDASSALSIATIYFPSGTSPYRIALYPPDNVGFVSDLYTNAVSVINLSTNSLVPADTIPVGDAPYGITCISRQVFVANSGYGKGNTVSVIDASTRKVVKTLKVGEGPTEIEPDGNGYVWVVCPGQIGSNGSIYIVNIKSDTVADSINVGMQIPSFTGHTLAMDQKNGYGYLIADSSVVKLDLLSKTIMDKNLIRGSFYAISVDLSNGDIYVADAKDYKTAGTVYIYNSYGQSTGRSFTTGINPDGMAFVR